MRLDNAWHISIYLYMTNHWVLCVWPRQCWLWHVWRIQSSTGRPSPGCFEKRKPWAWPVLTWSLWLHSQGEMFQNITFKLKPCNYGQFAETAKRDSKCLVLSERLKILLYNCLRDNAPCHCGQIMMSRWCFVILNDVRMHNFDLVIAIWP